LEFGADCNLYRGNPNVLRTGDSLQVDGTLFLGSLADVNLYRSTANWLVTDDNLHVAGVLRIGGSDVELSRGGANILNTTDQFRCLSIGANIGYAPGDGDINAGRYLRTDGDRVMFHDSNWLRRNGTHIEWWNGSTYVQLD